MDHLQTDIPPLSKTKKELYRSLDSAKLRHRKGLFIAEGEKLVGDLVARFDPEAVILREEALAAGEIGEAFLEYFSPGILKKAAGQIMRELSCLITPGNVIGIFRLPSSVVLGQEAENGERPAESVPRLEPEKLYLLLDGVRDPGNFGSIIRTADWFGIHQVFASKDSADLFNPKVLQATMGSAARVDVRYLSLVDLVRANPELPLVGTLLEGENIYSTPLPAGALIAMGNEGKGLSEELRKKVRLPLNIPPVTEIHGESLNVGAATAVVLSQFRAKELSRF